MRWIAERGMAVSLEAFDSRIQSPADVKSALRIPFLGMLPRVPSRALRGSAPLLNRGVRGALLLGIVTTGILFVVKNFPIFIFSPEFIIALNLSHLGFVMAFLLVNLYCLIFKKRWTKAR